MNKSRSFLLGTFLVVSLFQLLFIYRIVHNYNALLNEGETYFFQLQMDDPSDVFRGKYLQLRFKNCTYLKPDSLQLMPGQTIWVKIKKDVNGFAKIDRLYSDKPKNLKWVVKAKTGYMSPSGNTQGIEIIFPFQKFYLNENTARELENLPHPSVSNDVDNYAGVKLWNGKAVIEYLVLNGKQIGS